MKDLYQEIRAQIEANTSVTHVRLWNNQTRWSEEGSQIPFKYPAVFVEFPNITWIQGAKGTQKTAEEFTIRLHICFESYNTDEQEEDLALFDLRQEVYMAVQDFKPTMAGVLQRRAEQSDPEHTNVYKWVMDFTTQYQDNTAMTPRDSVTAQLNTININAFMQIDPNTTDGVNTDKDFS